MKQLKLHVRHEDPEIMSIAHIHVLLLSSAISFIVSPALPSSSPVLVLTLKTIGLPHCSYTSLFYDRFPSVATFQYRRFGRESVSYSETNWRESF